MHFVSNVRIYVDKFKILSIVDKNLVKWLDCWNQINSKFFEKCGCDVFKVRDSETFHVSIEDEAAPCQDIYGECGGWCHCC